MRPWTSPRRRPRLQSECPRSRPPATLSAPLGLSKHAGNVDKHSREHGGGEPPRVGVLPRAMIAIEHRLAAGQRMTGAVGEGVVTPLKLKRIERALMRDAA